MVNENSDFDRYDQDFDSWISEMLDEGDKLISRVKGKKLSEFTKEEMNTWLGICSEIAGFEDDEGMSKETQARYNYWFSDVWYENDPIEDMRIDNQIKEKFKEMQEIKEWEKDNADKIVKVRYGDLIRIAESMVMLADDIECESEWNEDDLRELYYYAEELINLPEMAEKPEVLQ